MKDFKELREKFQKGFSIPHLVNPTVSETIRLIKNSRYNSLRAYIAQDQNLYVWDADKAIHFNFSKDELFENGKIDIVDRANIDPFKNTEGTIIGSNFYHPKFKKWTEDVLRNVSFVFDGNFINKFVEPNHGTYYDWMSNEKV